MTYRLVNEDKLRRYIEASLIYDELCAAGVDNWVGMEEIRFPDIDDIEKILKNYEKI